MVVPCCLHAPLPVRIGVLPSKSPPTPQSRIPAWKRSLALASAPADRNQRPKRASCVQISVHPLTSGHVMDVCRVAGRAWAGTVAYNGGVVHALRRATNLNSSLVLAVFGGHLGGQVLQFCRKGQVIWRLRKAWLGLDPQCATTPRKWRPPFCGYILGHASVYLGPASGVQRAFSVTVCSLLLSTMASVKAKLL